VEFTESENELFWRETAISAYKITKL
jgi:hypothetical protein